MNSKLFYLPFGKLPTVATNFGKSPKIAEIRVCVLAASMLCIVVSTQAQNNTSSKNDSITYSIISSNVGVGGSSNNVTTANGNYKVSQSIGQASVIGTHTNGEYHLSQGYQQQTLLEISIIKDLGEKNLGAIIFPNPFEQSVNISFSDEILKDISVVVFNIQGSLIYSQKFNPAQSIELMLGDISSGVYLLNAISNGKQFNAKIIKK